MYRSKSEKRTWKVALGILILMCCFAVQSLTGSYANAQQPDKRLISVTGEYTLYVKPDVARVSFGVETDGKTAKEAQSTNSKLMNQVISKLASCGISKEDIQTSNFSLYPIYEMPEDGRGTRAVLISYRSVSYTHLDVYKRQPLSRDNFGVYAVGFHEILKVQSGFFHPYILCCYAWPPNCFLQLSNKSVKVFIYVRHLRLHLIHFANLL